MTKRHIVYETHAQVQYPNRQTDQFAMCGCWTPASEQCCIDDPLWASPRFEAHICKRCRAKAETLVEIVGGLPVVKPGLTIPTVRQPRRKSTVR